MRIGRLSLYNWARYRGEYHLVLEAKAYGIAARHVRDPGRSNWLGKSLLHEAVRFVFYGTHRHRLEEGWITRGEDEGHVELELDTGQCARRSKVRGKPTRLKFDGAAKDEAQKAIERAIGLSELDFLATCYFEQRKMARLVLAEPRDRAAVVTGWLRMEKLVKAEELHSDRAAKLAADAGTIRQNIEIARGLQAEALDGGTIESLAKAIEDVRSKVSGAREAMAKSQLVYEENEKIIFQAQQVQRYQELVEKGKELRARVDKVDEVVLQKAADKAEALSLASGAEEKRLVSRVVELEELVAKKFSGVCPVALIQCPAAAEINGRVAQNKVLLRKATTELEEHTVGYRKLAKDCHAKQNALESYRSDVQELSHLRAEAMRHKPEPAAFKAKPVEREQLRAKLRSTAEELAKVEAQLSTMVGRHVFAIKAAAEQKMLLGKLVEIDARLAVEREAAVVFGKQGAQRRVAEGALADISRGANGALAASGIELSVKIRWSREGEGLAAVCDACGNPFPKSRKVKECEGCGAARGANLINKLDIEQSDESGATGDLAGAMIQLAGGAWLRRDRGSRWASALIDEPFGQLDETHQRALAAHFSALLRNNQYEQAFIIAHHRGALEALPGRIEIVSDGMYSTVKVAA
jgi:DNA repair exonuclease SbcCD ATPase subunit